MEQEKWCVMYLDCLKCTIDILGVFSDPRDAILFMNNKVDQVKEWTDSSYFRKHQDNTYTISVYQANWFSEKTLIARYIISKYTDC